MEPSRTKIICEVSKTPSVFPTCGIDNICLGTELLGEIAIFMSSGSILKYLPSFQNPKAMKILIYQ